MLDFGTAFAQLVEMVNIGLFIINYFDVSVNEIIAIFFDLESEVGYRTKNIFNEIFSPAISQLDKLFWVKFFHGVSPEPTAPVKIRLTAFSGTGNPNQTMPE
jgi:hypothetical protein